MGCDACDTRQWQNMWRTMYVILNRTIFAFWNFSETVFVNRVSDYVFLIMYVCCRQKDQDNLISNMPRNRNCVNCIHK